MNPWPDEQNELQKIRKELIDARVVEGHIIPNRLLFTSHAPSQEYPTVAWLPDGIQAKPISCGHFSVYISPQVYFKY